MNTRKFSIFVAIMVLPVLPAQASVHSQAQITIHAPVERVWTLVTEIDHWPEWNKAVETAHLDGPVAKGSVFKWHSGGFDVTSTFQDVKPMTALSWTGVAFGTTAVHSWTFRTTGNGVVVKTEETFGSWLPFLLPGMMQNTLNDTLPKLLASLKIAAERQPVR